MKAVVLQSCGGFYGVTVKILDDDEAGKLRERLANPDVKKGVADTWFMEVDDGPEVSIQIFDLENNGTTFVYDTGGLPEEAIVAGKLGLLD